MLMMRPQPRAIIAGANACARKKGASRLMRRTASQSASVMSSMGFLMLMPAALTRMSGGPNGRAASAAMVRSSARSARSMTSAAARPPLAAMPRLAVSSSASRRAARTIVAPASASANAISRPMPELPPVTSATRPSRLKMAGAGMDGPSAGDRLAQLEALLGEVAREPLVGGARVRLHPFEPRDARGRLPDRQVGGARHALPGHSLDELVHRQAPGVLGGSAR